MFHIALYHLQDYQYGRYYYYYILTIRHIPDCGLVHHFIIDVDR